MAADVSAAARTHFASSLNGASAEAAKARITAVRPALSHERRYDVLFVTQDSHLFEQVSADFLSRSLFNLRLFHGGLAELEKQLAAVAMPNVLVADLAQGTATDIEALERLKKSAFLKVPVVAISNHHDQQILRGLMQVKVDDWLPAGCNSAEIHGSCEVALLERLSDASDGQAKCTAFLPSGGGCGNTTLAIEAAFIIGNKKKQLQSTCLVDLNFQDGAVADYLDLTPALQLSEISSEAGRLDRQLLDVMLTRHSSGLTVLAAPRSPGRSLDVDEAVVTSILGILSEAFDHLIIDLPKNWSPWTDNVIWGADRIFVVCGFTVPALRHARSLADVIATKASASAEVSVLVNKFHEPFVGVGLGRKDAEAILEARLGGFIPNLGGVVEDAINRGVTLSESRAGNKIAKKLSQILVDDFRAGKAKKK